jgi:type III pantothenate kinase
MIAVDIGNTTIGLGLFEGRELLRSWRVRTDREKTSDEYGVLFIDLFRNGGYDPKSVRGGIVSSVVPPLSPVIEETIEQIFSIKPLVVGPGLKTGMPILYDNPHEVGADRIAGAVAAFEKYGGPTVVVDFGTATTFDVISARGEYLGGAIAPGMKIAAEALYLKTAKLPRIEIKKPAKAIGRNTVSSMQSGLYYGYLGLVTRTIEVIRQELGENIRVIATGGFGGQFVSEVPQIEAYEPDLLLEGLLILYERNV